MVRIRIAKRRVEAYLMRYIIFYLLKKSNSFLEFFSFYFYITILMLYCQTNIDKMHKLLYIKNKRRLQAMKKFILGFITGGIICATATGFAVEYAVTANPFPVAVNGTETAIEGYNINDNTYFKLRDVADAVGGFNVGFSDNTITIDTDTAAEPTPTPTPSFTPAQISIVKGDDGYDYTSDGIEVEYVDGVAYIDETDIQYMLNKLNANNSNHSYHFGTDIIIDSETLDVVVDNIKRCNTDRRLIELDSYTTKILPFINSVTE